MKHIVILSKSDLRRSFIWKSLTFVFLIIILSSCKKNVGDFEKVKSNDVDLDSLPHYIQQRLIHGSQVFCDYPSEWIDSLKIFYQENNFEPLWLDIFKNQVKLEEEITALAFMAHHHGFDPHWYHFQWISDDLKRLKSNDSTSGSLLKLLAECEVAYSESILRMAYDICNGRVKPKKVFGRNYMLPLRESILPEINEILSKDKNLSKINQIHDKDTHYVFLQKVYQKYNAQISFDEPDIIDFGEIKKIEAGYDGEEILNIIKRLKYYHPKDTIFQNLKDTTLYTSQLKKVIKSFQKLNQLDDDGVIGYHTMVCLNRGYQDLANDVSTAMERQRWFTIPEKTPFVRVNLAYFKSYLHYDDSIKIIDVCIGKTLPAKATSGTTDMRTPQIYSKINSIVINPTWTVPYSIVSKEMLPKLKRDPEYIKRNNYVVFKNGEEVNPDSIDWKKYNVKNIPYKVVQSFGDDNALGKVKYMFHNPFSIYMHDTPIKSAFKLNTRAVSHGCVRLSDPILFGEFAIQGTKKYDSDEFRMMLGYAPIDEDYLEKWEEQDTVFLEKYQTDSIKSIWLENPIPVYFDYRTVFIDEENNHRHIYDVYGYNRKIWAAMRKY
jgi:murein L,D-transpeptidase YcbB/YkuD